MAQQEEKKTTGESGRQYSRSEINAMARNSLNASVKALGLKGEEQAALLLLSISEQNASDILRNLKREHVQRLVRAMTEIGHVTNKQLDVVLQRFFMDYKELSGVGRASREFMEKTLNMALGPELAKGLLDDVYGDRLKEKMQRLEWIEPSLIANVLQREMIPLQAAFLSFLPSETSSRVFSVLPENTHDELLRRLANMTEINQTIGMEMDRLVDRCFHQFRIGISSPVEGIRQAADMLARYGGNTQKLLEMLRIHDPDIAEEIMNEMFSFSILERQTPEILQEIVQIVPMDQWVIVLKGASDTLREKIFATLPKRQVIALEEDMRNAGALPASVVKAACDELMREIRIMVQEQGLKIQLFEEKVLE